MESASPLPRSVTLHGPQRLRPTVGETLVRLGVTGGVAAINAGWQEYEGEDDELLHHLGNRSFNLGLYRRAREVYAADPELAEATHRRQRRLRDLQSLYRLRLDHALEAARELRRPHRIERRLLDRSRTEAMAAVRQLDETHHQALQEVHAEFERRWRPARRDAVARQRSAIADLIAGCEAVAIAGGHVAVLLNRLRLFDIGSLLAGKRVIAWSAGAMVSGGRVVLFHDMPPQGAGNSEVFESGLGLYPDVLPFPHARHRLRCDDPARVAELAERYSPWVCTAMDEGGRLEWTPGRRWEAEAEGVARLERDGSVTGGGGW